MAENETTTTFTDQEWRAQPISILKVEVRARHVIRNAGIETIGQLMDWLEKEPGHILRTPNFGRTSLQRLQQQLAEKKTSADGRLALLEARRADTVRQLGNLSRQTEKKRAELADIERRIERLSHA